MTPQQKKAHVKTSRSQTLGDYGLTPEQITRIEDRDKAMEKVLDLVEHEHGVNVRAIARFMYVAGQLDANPSLAPEDITVRGLKLVRAYECMVIAFRHMCGIVDEECQQREFIQGALPDKPIPPVSTV